MASNQSTFTEEFGYLIDEFDELQDLRYSDLQNLDEYRTLKMQKNDGQAIDQNRLDQLEAVFQNKIVTSARWNKFQNALVGMQTFIKNEVDGYIQTKQDEFQAYIDRFENRGTYNPSVQYYKNNYVSYDDGAGSQLYIATSTPTIGTSPANTSYWQVITIKGEQGIRGIDGIGITPKGEWNSTTVYAKDDGVIYGGALFASVINDNLANEPIMGQDTDSWVQVMDITIVPTKLKGQRTIASSAGTVNFMVGEIVAFNSATDDLEVFVNSTAVEEGIDYNINPDNQSISKIDGIWDSGTMFYFRVTRNQINNLFFGDGQSIQDSTVTINKLHSDVLSHLFTLGTVRPSDGTLWFEEIV